MAVQQSAYIVVGEFESGDLANETVPADIVHCSIGAGLAGQTAQDPKPTAPGWDLGSEIPAALSTFP